MKEVVCLKYRNKEQIDYAVNVLEEASSTNPVALVTAQNAAEQKKKFIEKALPAVRAGEEIPESANPVFTYDEELLVKTAKYARAIEDAINLIEDNCDCENERDEAIKAIVLARAKDIYYTAKMAESILAKDDRETALYASKKYDCPSESLIAEAKEGIANKKPSGTKNSIVPEDAIDAMKDIKYSDSDLAVLFCMGISYLNLGFNPQPWSVVISEKVTAIDVRYQDHTVYIPKGTVKKGLKPLSLLFHEIWSHLLSSSNGELFFKTILKGTPFYRIAAPLANSHDETLYEGIAKMFDVMIGGDGELPKYSAVVAIDSAKQGRSFVETANELFKHQSVTIKPDASDEDIDKAYRDALSKAWGPTYRVYRGATDAVENKGQYAFPKDAAYLNGYQIACKLNLEENPIYAQYSSMRIADIDLLDKAFPELRTTPRNYDRQDMLYYAISLIT